MHNFIFYILPYLGYAIFVTLILRDFLRRECPEAYDKTSKACLKRLVSKLRKDEPKHDYLLDQLVADKIFIRQFGEDAIRIGNKIRLAAGLDKNDEGEGSV